MEPIQVLEYVFIFAIGLALKDFSMPEVDIEKVRFMVGGGARELLKRFFSDGLLEHALQIFRCYYYKEPVIHTRPFEGIVDLLEYAKRKGLDLAVITNKMEELSKVILIELGLLEYFSLVVGGDTYPETYPSFHPLPTVLTAKRE